MKKILRRKEIYLDSAAMYPVLPVAQDAYRSALLGCFGNPSSSHEYGVRAREALEKARADVASCLGAKPEEVFFFSNATEAAATVIRTCEAQGIFVVASSVEHHAVSENIEFGCISALNDTMRMEDEVAYCRMLVNNETGEVFTRPEPTEGLWVCDATAAVGHMPVSFSDLGADYLFGDGLKFGGVSGAAFLVVRSGAPLVPLVRGGGQERGMRAGTENVPAIAAMSAALQWQTERLDRSQGYYETLRDVMLSELDDSGVPFIVNTPLERSASHILNVSFPGTEGSALALYLSGMGVMVSAGAACSNGLNEPSHVLMSMFGDEARARSAIRLSFSHETTVDSIIYAASKIAESVRTLRGISAK